MRPGVCVDVAGTASVFAATTADFRADEEDMVLSCGRSAIPGLWHPYAYINGGRHEPGMVPRADCRRLCGGRTMPRLRASERDGGSSDLLRRTTRSSSRTWGAGSAPSQPHLRGAWVGLTWSHGPGHLYRAVLEGVALEYGIYLRTLEKLFGAGTVAEVRVTGGGEKSGVWNRIKADTLGVPIVQVMGAGGAPLGSALLAAVRRGGAAGYRGCRRAMDSHGRGHRRAGPAARGGVPAQDGALHVAPGIDMNRLGGRGEGKTG